MLNLIKMDMYRLLKTKSYKFGLLVSLLIPFVAIAAIAGIGKLVPMLSQADATGETGDILSLLPFSDWFSGTSLFIIVLTATSFLSLMVSCMITSTFVNEEQAGGYIKNIAGQVKSKGMLVVSKFVTIAVVSLTVLIAYIIGSSASALLFFGKTLTYTGAGKFIEILLIRYLLFIAVNVIVLFLCTLTKSKTLAVAFGIIFGTGATKFIYSIISTFADLVLNVSISISSYTPDGLIFNIGVDSAAGELVKAVLVGIGYIAVFMVLTTVVLTKRDTK